VHIDGVSLPTAIRCKVRGEVVCGESMAGERSGIRSSTIRSRVIESWRGIYRLAVTFMVQRCHQSGIMTLGTRNGMSEVL